MEYIVYNDHLRLLQSIFCALTLSWDPDATFVEPPIEEEEVVAAPE